MSNKFRYVYHPIEAPNIPLNQPLVTVYIPTFNRVELLKRAVESVRNQTYSNLEIIVVDDCSTDYTHEYLKKISEEDSRIKFFIKEKNSGACISRNIAIENATGDFITGLDDDDYFKNDRIEVFLKEALKDNNKIYFTTNAIKLTDEIIKKPSIFSKYKRDKITHKDLLRINYIGNQIFIKTNLIRKVGGFDQNLKAWQDLECWYNLMKILNIEAKRINHCTQVIDISHTHERISTKNLNNIFESFSYFIEKHKLNRIERFLLEGQLIQYNPNNYNKFKKIIYLVSTRNLFFIKDILGKS